MTTATTTPGGPLDALIASWLRSLRARNLSAQTLATYAAAAHQFDAHLAAAGAPAVTDVTRADVEDFITSLLGTRSPATANNRYRALQQFFGWLLDEEEIDRSPMERMKPPIVPEQPVDVIHEDDLRRLLKGCDGRHFVARRDSAAIRLWLDTGMRRAELGSLAVADVDLDQQVALVLGKGRRPRACPFGSRTSLALDRYLRLRARTTHAASAALRLGEKGKGPMTTDGLYQMLVRRGQAVGMTIHPHQLRWMERAGPIRSTAGPPFPLDPLPERLSRMVEPLSVSTQTPPDLGGLLALSATAAAVAPRYRVTVPGHDWTEPLNIYSVTALVTGTRKSPVSGLSPLRCSKLRAFCSLGRGTISLQLSGHTGSPKPA